MNIQITSRHSKVSQDTQAYLKNELNSLDKYYDKITSGHVIIDSENILKIVEIVLNIQGSTINAKAKSENFGKSVDMALNKVIRQLKKTNEKIKGHKKVREVPA